MAYVFWVIGEYPVRYLRRTREYAADGFAATYAAPDNLSMALVKIAVGLVSSDVHPELVNATRHLRIMSVAQSKEKGLIDYNAREHEEMAPSSRPCCSIR